jgi:transitional endoplasmic reticulum ATPase
MSELTDLISIAEQSPEKTSLVRAVLRAADEAVDPGPAVDWLAGIDPSRHDAPARIDVAAFLTDQGAAEAALAWTEGSDGAVRVARARALLALGQTAEAAELYGAAVGADPTLADPDLDAALAVRQAAGESNVVSLHGRPLAASQGGPNQPAPRRETKTFADVGGLAEVKKDINRKIILPFKQPALFNKFKRKSGGGILLYGPPGCGKTMLARATAGEVGAAFVSIEIAEILDMYVGQSEKRLSSAFATARASKPTVLFFDEIEALAARRRFGESNTGASMVSTFLNEFDGVHADNEGVLVLAATNVPWAIDAAFRRPGRFDRILFIPPPDREARLAILDLALKDRPHEGLNLEVLAHATSGFSGADLVGIVESACDLAIEESLETESIVPVRQKHVTEAAKGVKPTTLEWLSQARNYAKYANEGGLYDEVIAFLDKHAK